MPLMRYILFRAVFQLLRNIDNIIAFDMGCLYLTDSFFVIFVNFFVSHIFIGLYFSCKQHGPIINRFDPVTFKI